jgi:hypothetical protein
MRDKLTALKVASLKKPGRYADGGGLYLHVPRPGARYWQFRYMIDGRAREMGLGPVADISLAEARELATRARAMVRDKCDPLEAKRKARDEARNASGERQPFRDAAEEFISVHNPTWRNERHQKQWPATLKAYAYPTLGNRPIGEIDGALRGSSASYNGSRTASRCQTSTPRSPSVISRPCPTKTCPSS